MTPEIELRGRKVWVTDKWADVERELPQTLSEKQIGWLKIYFEVQCEIARNNLGKATEIAKELYSFGGVDEFEERHEGYFAAIDVAGRGETTRYIRPAFEVSREAA